MTNETTAVSLCPVDHLITRIERAKRKHRLSDTEVANQAGIGRATLDRLRKDLSLARAETIDSVNQWLEKAEALPAIDDAQEVMWRRELHGAIDQLDGETLKILRNQIMRMLAVQLATGEFRDDVAAALANRPAEADPNVTVDAKGIADDADLPRRPGEQSVPKAS